MSASYNGTSLGGGDRKINSSIQYPPHSQFTLGYIKLFLKNK